jgi:signal transduction histidine kinase
MLARAVEKMREKLEGKAYVEEMVSNFSHELKTPLASIRGAAEILEDGAMNDPSARARFLSNIRTDVQRLDRVVTNFLKLSRIEARLAPASADSIDLTSACREIIEIYRAQAERCGIQIRATLPNVPVKAQIGESELKQIVGNLLENALQFTPQGRAITLSLTTEDSHAVLRVRDEGCGIEPDLLPRIFERFFTTENPRTKERGTGLGLAIVRSLVEANHGSISAKSQRGAGAEFEVRFPGFPERP